MRALEARPNLLAMSARNRELMALIPASLLVTAGFAAIFIQRNEVLSNVSLTYGAALPRAVLRRAPRDPLHAAVRGPVPVPARGRPGVLRARRDLPHRRGPRARAGAVVRDRPDRVRADDLPAARLPRAGALPLHDRVRRARAAAAPARARDRPAGQRRLPRRGGRPDLLPAGRAGQDRDRHLPRRLPAGQPPRARAGLAPHPGRHDPAAQAPRPAARGLGRRRCSCSSSSATSARR